MRYIISLTILLAVTAYTVSAQSLTQPWAVGDCGGGMSSGGGLVQQASIGQPVVQTMMQIEALTLESGYIFGISDPDDTPLPIQLASFTANIAENRVNLEWITISEINNYGFYVERRFDRTSNYLTVSGLIPGFRTTLEQHNYLWTDSNVAAGAAYYYRLRQVDLTGDVNYSSEIRIDISGITGASFVEGTARTFELHQNYPNPFNPSTNIQFGIPQKSIATIVVYNTLGQEVKRLVEGAEVFPGTFEVHWDGRDQQGNPVSSGLYFYRIVATPIDNGSNVFSDIRKMLLLK